MNLKIFFLLVFLPGLVNSCIVEKDDRILKRTTKDWRAVAIVFSAYADTPLSGIFLNLRENGKFEHTVSGMWQSFQAGNWTIHQDTIKLTYLNSKLDVLRIQKCIIDKKTSTLIFEGDDTPVFARLRIMSNEIQ